MLAAMAIQRMDHVSVVVSDLAAAVAFFATLGMEQEGAATVEGPWVDRVNGMDGVCAEIVMMAAPDGHGKLELTAFRSPAVISPEPAVAPSNTLGLRSVMFLVDDIEDDVKRLAAHGGELIGEIADFEDVYRLCYLRGPGGIIVALAQELRN
jgi:catechol 2,3-dioxygenase-like lactoylglutathione lyase family enzyme